MDCWYHGKPGSWSIPYVTGQIGQMIGWQLLKAHALLWIFSLCHLRRILLRVCYRGRLQGVSTDLSSAPVNVGQCQTPPEVPQLVLQPLPLLSHFLPLTDQVLVKKKKIRGYRNQNCLLVTRKRCQRDDRCDCTVDTYTHGQGKLLGSSGQIIVLCFQLFALTVKYLPLYIPL